jgi:hypothetical protein
VADDDITCPHREEVQPKKDFRCTRCGESFETKEQRKQQLADLEQSRREAERASVSIQRFPGFGTNGNKTAAFGTRQFWVEMSNQRRHLFLVVCLLFAIGLAFFYSR